MNGGGAWVRSEHSEIVGFLVGPTSLTHGGWTVGGGIEWRFAHNWSAFVEYSHMDLRKKYLSLNGFDVAQEVQVLMVGVNYRFGGGPVVARY